jgi:hypothetical protein
VVFPNAYATPSHCHLRPLLKRWASHYTTDNARSDMLVEMTISAAIDGPLLEFDEPIEEALCHLMHRLALREFNLPRDTPALYEIEEKVE